MRRRLKVLLAAGIILAAYLISANCFQLVMIQGRSMEPAYHPTQMVLVDKMHRDFRRGDVICFFSEGLRAVLIKRVAACPGDRILICDGAVYVNGTPEYFPRENEVLEAGSLEEELEVGPGEYVALGDNLAESIDSRSPEVGVVTESSIRGKVIWPRRQLSRQP